MRELDDGGALEEEGRLNGGGLAAAQGPRIGEEVVGDTCRGRVKCGGEGESACLCGQGEPCRGLRCAGLVAGLVYAELILGGGGRGSAAPETNGGGLEASLAERELLGLSDKVGRKTPYLPPGRPPLPPAPPPRLLLPRLKLG